MKKVSILILSILFSLLFYNNTQALSVADFTPAIDKKVANMKTTQEKVEYLRSLADLLTTPKFTQDKNARLYADLREYVLNMLKVFEYELKEEQSKTQNSSNKKGSQTTSNKSTNNTNSTTKKLPHLLDNFSNINEQKVRDAVLSRHNEERKNVWVNPYIYNIDLEWSATTRANSLAKTWKTSNLHIRNSWDGYYNYNSILNRFWDLGINFPTSTKWAASFSETIWYGSYKCSKNDCTQELINAIKKTRNNLIMKEKSSKGSHYKAATMKHFTQMWIWIALDKAHNRYYLVIHYSVDFN